MIKQPPALRKGDTIAIVCPAGNIEAKKVEKCISTLKQWGYNVKVGFTVGTQFNSFSADDKERFYDLQNMLDDKEISAILCARGGYGTSRIVDSLDWRIFKRYPKWIIGFSDITVLHSTLHTKLKTASLHASMANEFNKGDVDKNENLLSLKKALAGNKINYKIPADPLNIAGKVQGQLVGGNLSLLAHMVGTKSDLDLSGKILVIEDLNEYTYHIDRMMLQLSRSRNFQELGGLIVGGFTDIKETNPPFAHNVKEVIRTYTAPFNTPTCFDFPVSHGDENLCLKLGFTYDLNIGKTVTLKEI